MTMHPATSRPSHCAEAAASRTPALAVIICLALIAVFTVLPEPAAAISRNTVLFRAQLRVDKPVKYSQKKYYAGYRTDCSGYVSMTWKTGTSWNTRTFHKVTHRIKVSQLQPGDALLKKGYHIRLFYGWLDEARTQYVAYESAYGKIAGIRIHSIEDDLEYGYVPVRYDRITASPASRNLLRNPTFNTWAQDWNGTLPVWWDVSGEWWETNCAMRKDIYRTARNSLQLTNPASTGQPVTLSQTVPVKAGAEYRVKSWVRTVDPNAISLSLTYLDAQGESIVESSTAGDRWGINPDQFKSMAFNLKAPANAVSARVTVSLSPGTDPVTGAPSRNVAVVDDVSLYRPQVTVGIKSSKSSSKRGKSFTLSGTVTPARAKGVSAILYVKKPGGSWKKLSTVKIGASGSTTMWKKKVAISRTARKGTYKYRISVPQFPGYLGSMSKTVSVKVK